MQNDAEMLRLRTVAAAALLLAGITLGFVLGRMSVWVISAAPSPETAARAASDRNATAPAPKTASSAPALPAPGSSTPSATPSPATPEQPAVALNPGAPAVASPSIAASGGAPVPAPDPAAAAVGTQEPPKPVVAPNWRPAAGDPSGSGSANGKEANGAPGVKLVNPNPTQADAAAVPARKAEPDAAESEADRQDLAACERRYSSFRRSDGTYQPFGGGPRQRCPTLR